MTLEYNFWKEELFSRLNAFESDHPVGETSQIGKSHPHVNFEKYYSIERRAQKEGTGY